MRRLLLSYCLFCMTHLLQAQYVYTINADSVKITNHCDTAELIIENHTQHVPGFLFNKGRGRTEFRKVMQQLNPTTYLIGGDTLFTSPNAWMQGGNSFGTTGILGTFDNNHLDIYTNSSQKARFTNTGNLLLGATADNGYRLQLQGSTSSSIYFNPGLSRPTDRMRIGGLLNTADGQNSIIQMSNDGGGTYSNVLVERDGYIGMGVSPAVPQGWVVANPALRIYPWGDVSVVGPGFYLGRENGPANSSRLIMTVSNTNEWTQGDGYPNGQNSYYFGTQLLGLQQGQNFVRPPLNISARSLHFQVGQPDAEAGMFSESGNLVLGSNADAGYKLQVLGGHSLFNNSILFDDGRFGPPNLVARFFAGRAIYYQSNNSGDQHIFENNIGTGFTGNLVTLDPGAYPGLNDAQLSLRVRGKYGTVGLNVNMIGYTGIGTETPTAQLHTTGSVRFAGLTSDTSLNRVLVSDASGNLYYRNLSSWSSAMIFQSGLTVNGILSAQKIKLRPVQWADYVFDNAYRLPSLGEIENYIQQHKHLPGIPSATEVAANGVDMGESQAALLQKIEELTLYILQQEKKIQQ
ncbi:MAG: hypothetical protein JST39_19195, partial [Bacteroidetes bacterium]|nr:hypothetical protein [Bacteroidota bacterium]